MRSIESHWHHGESRIEEGIFFGNDEFIPLTGHPENGYTAGERTSIFSLLEAEPDGWTDLDSYVNHSISNSDILIFAGATSWEGEGFIAAEESSTRNLLWLLHLSQSEPFVKITCEGQLIYASSSEYPQDFEWIIPINAPQLLMVKPKEN